MSETELDLSGKEGGDTPEAPKRGRPKGSRTRSQASTAKEAEAQKAIESTLKRIGDILQPKAPDFAATFKRDAGKMAQAVAHQASKRPGVFRVVMLLFGPGSLAFAVEAFAPTLLHVRAYMRERREERIRAQAEAEAAGERGAPLV